MSQPAAVGGESFLSAASESLQIACRFRTEVLPDDSQAVRKLVERTGFFHPDEIDIAVELVDEHLARGPASGYHFVFVDQGDALIGYACYGAIPCTRSSFDLYWIAVDPAFQKHGLGRALLSAAEALIAEAGGQQVYIDTAGRGQYAPTRAFYERCDYRCAARLEDFYAPGDDRVIYVKVLQ